MPAGDVEPEQHAAGQHREQDPVRDSSQRLAVGASEHRDHGQREGDAPEPGRDGAGVGQPHEPRPHRQRHVARQQRGERQQA